jgi:hypothetical protein
VAANEIGERVSYRDAGAAQRQAHDRARACTDLTFADWKVLDNVLDKTTSFSKLADHVFQADLARGVSPRQVRRSLRRLAGRGVLAYTSGLGAGNPTVVAVPPAGRKADERLSALRASDPSAFPPEPKTKSRQDAHLKADSHARACKPRSTEKKNHNGSTKERTSEPRPSRLERDAVVGEGTGESSVESAERLIEKLHARREHERGSLVRDTIERARQASIRANGGQADATGPPIVWPELLPGEAGALADCQALVDAGQAEWAEQRAAGDAER